MTIILTMQHLLNILFVNGFHFGRRPVLKTNWRRKICGATCVKNGNRRRLKVTSIVLHHADDLRRNPFDQFYTKAVLLPATIYFPGVDQVSGIAYIEEKIL